MYNSWPNGKLPIIFRRPELDIVMQAKGLKEPFEVVDLFEKTMADFCGSKYAVAVDNCTDAIFLCLEWKKYIGWLDCATNIISIPKHTYISVPQTIIHAGFRIRWTDEKWRSGYQLKPFNIYDHAVQFKPNMANGGFTCLSFQIKKKLPIGKGGMILTDDLQAYKWFKKARYEGRDITKQYEDDKLDFIGWNMYMIPEDAARGLLLFESDMITQGSICDWSNYTDLSKQEIFKKWTV